MYLRLKQALAILAGGLLLTSSVFAQDTEMMDTVTFTITIENVSGEGTVPTGDVVSVPVGAEEAGPATPGNSYQFSFDAEPGQYLNFATMFGNSNDLFFAPSEEGIALFDMDGAPISGDVTDQVQLWDAGTEVNEEPNVGPNQAPRQPAPNTGDDEMGVVTADIMDGFTYPAVSELLSVTVESMDNHFTVTINNISGNAAISTPLSPVLWVLQVDPAPFFTTNEPDRHLGLERLAEDGNPSVLAHAVLGSSVVSPLSPLAYVVHTEAGPIFITGEAAPDNGLEQLAEEGDSTNLGDHLTMSFENSGIINVPVDAMDPGPALPGGAYQFTIQAAPGEYLSFATMLGQSNDLFFGPDENGIALFDMDGNPISGDVTTQVHLWDAGTEVNEPIGEGPNQAPRQPAPNTGEDEMGVVTLIHDGMLTSSMDMSSEEMDMADEETSEESMADEDMATDDMSSDEMDMDEGMDDMGIHYPNASEIIRVTIDVTP
ncbi:spondin domain-containing protein [Phototrophicus methaneseepsis]|uniref:Spondin domain-containing protein n=1 Tax=Phototrophicus methaneseepsis TaxID=2710758 RepID=A0A7S8EE66_9CHLR|nr:spondin domain-containing protein [Phototrophicus methaneseepsis]QPC85073.1 spondin domain-containing protein [Phototrophicus methaneseepsis]